MLYEDTTRIHEFQQKFKMYEDKFPQCRCCYCRLLIYRLIRRIGSEQTNGMMTYIRELHLDLYD